MYQHFVAYAHQTGTNSGFGNRVVKASTEMLSYEDMDEINNIIKIENEFASVVIISTQLLRGE